MSPAQPLAAAEVLVAELVQCQAYSFMVCVEFHTYKHHYSVCLLTGRGTSLFPLLFEQVVLHLQLLCVEADNVVSSEHIRLYLACSQQCSHAGCIHMYRY